MGMAERIKEQRIKMGYTQEELAAKLGLQKSAIAKYENGRVQNIKRGVISDMAKVLECNPSYLMGWEPVGELNSCSGLLSTEKERVIDDLRNLFSDIEFNHFEVFDSLSSGNKEKVIAYAQNLLNIQKMEEEQSILSQKISL